MSVRVEVIQVRASNGTVIQAPASVWLSAIINSMTPKDRDTLFHRVEGKISPLIVTPASVNGTKMTLKRLPEA